MNRQLNLLTPESTLFETFLVKRERPITVLVTLCGVLAFLFGISWCLIKEESLLYFYLGLHISYLIGQKYWKFRDPNQATEAKDTLCEQVLA